MKHNNDMPLWFLIIIFVVLLQMVFANSALSVLALPQFESREGQARLEQNALQGSPEASDKIVHVLALFPGSDKFYWATIAAENNSNNGAVNMANFLSDPGTNGVELYGDYKRDRQHFWLKIAAKNNDTDAQKLLQKYFSDVSKMRIEPEKEISTWVVTKKTLPKFKRAAMLGSSEAAYKLYEHFRFSNPRQKESFFWATVAAQNGHPKAPSVVGKIMLKSENPLDRERAQFWLGKASASGQRATR